MSSTESEDTKRVSTYVPSEQKSEWQDHAEELNMTQSEFLRTMVQAGRRDFTIAHERSDTSEGSGGADLRDALLDTLQAEEAMNWDELVSELTGSIESDLETALDELQDENRVKYSGRHGGYTLNGDQQ